MPKVGGTNIEECMEICMSDDKLKEEIADDGKRNEMCYAACMANLEGKELKTFEVRAEDGKYIIDGNPNPILVLIRGHEYVFNVDAEGHPLWIKTSPELGAVDDYPYGVTNNGTDRGEVMFRVPNEAPSRLYYVCEFHDTMRNEIRVMDPAEYKLFELVEKYKNK